MNNGIHRGNLKDTRQDVIDSIDGVVKYDSKNGASGSGKLGTLCLSTNGLCLILASCEEIPDHLPADLDIHFYVSLHSVKNAALSIDGSKCTDFAEMYPIEDQMVEKLILHCKDFREVVFHFRLQNKLQRFLTSLWIKLYKNTDMIDYSFSWSVDRCETLSFMDRYSWENEMVRLKINVKKTKWKIMDTNEKFESCEFIGPYCVIPNSIDQGVVARTGLHHINNRFVTWCWTDNETMVSLLRCSEPTSMLNNNYLNKILNTVNNGPAKTYSVMSTAKLKDSCPNEEQISISFDKLWNACLAKDDQAFFKSFESSKWLQHIQSFIRAARHIARTLKCDKHPVVVMDQSGRDISCIVVSIVLILCDRYYRTTVGFANLINKEWVAAGYSFKSSFMSVNSVIDENQSIFFPTFIIFMDCVQNIINQYPIEFEFTDMYLIEILDHMLEGVSPMFMFNCPKDMSDKYNRNVNILVDTFWARVFKSRSKYNNPLFSLKDIILRIPQNDTNFDEESFRARASSYMYAVSKGYEKEPEIAKAKKRSSVLMLKAIKKPNFHLNFHRGRKKSKRKKDKLASSSFYSDCESPRQRLSSIQNIFKSKFDPININYSMINMVLWERYYFRHFGVFDNWNHAEKLLNNLVKNVVTSCPDLSRSQTSDDFDFSDHDAELLVRSDSVATLNSDRLERSVHLSDIDLCNDHVDKDYESAEELSLNGLSMENSVDSLRINSSVSPGEPDKRLSHVFEELEMSNTKSPQTVELEIAEATNDIHDV